MYDGHETYYAHDKKDEFVPQSNDWVKALSLLGIRDVAWDMLQVFFVFTL